MIIFRRWMVLLFFFFCETVSAFQRTTQDSSSSLPKHEIPYSIFLGYANDDFFIEKEINSVLNRKIFPSRDDFVTASFFLIGNMAIEDYTFSVNSYYHILTDRNNNFRTDILAVRATAEKTISDFRIRIGTGFHIEGNLGGRNIQNGYHKLFNYKPVDLQYSQNRTAGVLFSGRCEYLLMVKNEFELSPFLASTYSSNSYLPSNLNIGSTFNYYFEHSDWNLVVGYLNRQSVNEKYHSIFKTSWYGGVLQNIEITRPWYVSWWVTKDQFGIHNDFHFGITIIWKKGSIRSPMLKDLTFP